MVFNLCQQANSMLGRSKPPPIRLLNYYIIVWLSMCRFNIYVSKLQLWLSQLPDFGARFSPMFRDFQFSSRLSKSSFRAAKSTMFARNIKIKKRRWSCSTMENNQRFGAVKPSTMGFLWFFKLIERHHYVAVGQVHKFASLKIGQTPHIIYHHFTHQNQNDDNVGTTYSIFRHAQWFVCLLSHISVNIHCTSPSYLPTCCWDFPTKET